MPIVKLYTEDINGLKTILCDYMDVLSILVRPLKMNLHCKSFLFSLLVFFWIVWFSAMVGVVSVNVKGFATLHKQIYFRQHLIQFCAKIIGLQDTNVQSVKQCSFLRESRTLINPATHKSNGTAILLHESFISLWDNVTHMVLTQGHLNFHNFLMVYNNIIYSKHPYAAKWN